MKCALCEGGLKEETIEYKEFGVSLGKFLGKRCVSCGEVFFGGEVVEKIQKKSKELGLFGLAKKARIAQLGNSIAVRIPKELAEFLHLKKEDEVRISPFGKKGLLIEMKDSVKV
ncbi:MAG: AbrB/MazE/SpoVT family DNA-binding domain-containing protein [Candidatus Nanoarchaeia archaeon]